MIPNLRFNKKVTKQLLKAAIPKEHHIKLNSIEWNHENGNKIYGLIYQGWFKNTVYFLQRLDEGRYRLVKIDGSPMCDFYLIHDIETFLNQIGVEILELPNPEKVREAFEGTKDVPNSGIIIIEEGELYVYDHKNY